MYIYHQHPWITVLQLDILTSMSFPSWHDCSEKHQFRPSMEWTLTVSQQSMIQWYSVQYSVQYTAHHCKYTIECTDIGQHKCLWNGIQPVSYCNKINKKKISFIKNGERKPLSWKCWNYRNMDTPSSVCNQPMQLWKVTHCSIVTAHHQSVSNLNW